MPRVTVEQVIAWEPCGLDDENNGTNYTPQHIKTLFHGRKSLTANDIAALDIPREDVLWALLRNEFLTDEQMHLLACNFAESVVHLCDDPSAQAAIDAKRAWVRGEISDEELNTARAAAKAAARAAAKAAAWAAAWAAIANAAGAAARAAAGAAIANAAGVAVRAASRSAQIKMILEVVK